MKVMVSIAVASLMALGFPVDSDADGETDSAPADGGQEVADVGYVDADGDGANDRFRDSDGDGICDVTGLEYRHHFPFIDRDGDGLNDRFRDADGDGVNDLGGIWMDVDADGICDNVLDADGDGHNDITGEPYGRDLGGHRFGRIDETRGEQATRFVDEDEDGMHDAWSRGAGMMEMDVFIDEDGDGIADGRTVRGRLGAGWETEPMLGRRGRGTPRAEMAGEDEEAGQTRRRRGSKRERK